MESLLCLSPWCSFKAAPFKRLQGWIKPLEAQLIDLQYNLERDGSGKTAYMPIYLVSTQMQKLVFPYLAINNI